MIACVRQNFLISCLFRLHLEAKKGRRNELPSAQRALGEDGDILQEHNDEREGSIQRALEELCLEANFGIPLYFWAVPE